MTQRLAGKTAVITGGAGGIGQIIAERFAEEGANVAVADIADAAETGDLVTSKGGAFLGRICDLLDQESVNDFAAAAVERFGRVDILVNNAAIYPVVPFDQLDYELFFKVLRVNLGGQFLMAKAFVPGMREAKWGRIINLTTTGVWGRVPAFTAYITSKGAVNGFNNSLATELGASGITVNAIAPSLVRTPGTSQPGHEHQFTAIIERQTIPRLQTPQDVAGAAAFLASDDATFITGQILVVDGGATRR